MKLDAAYGMECGSMLREFGHSEPRLSRAYKLESLRVAVKDQQYEEKCFSQVSESVYYYNSKLKTGELINAMLHQLLL